jgi:hypothetical protein
MVIMALDFFKKIDGFEEQGETDQAARKEDNSEHTSTFVHTRPNPVPDRARRSCGWSCGSTAWLHPVKMKRNDPKWKSQAWKDNLYSSIFR